MATKKNPAAVSLGRLGGKKKGRKGLAAMDPERALEIRRAGAAAMWKKRRKGKAAAKKIAGS